MTRKKKSNSISRSLQIETLNHRIMLDGAGFIDPVFYGPTPYLSEADTPAGFVPVPDCDECVVGLETFEDDSLDFGLQITDGQIIGPGFSTGIENLTDSVDGDDGLIDGTGQSNNLGYSYFSFGNSITVTLPSLMQSAGIVWTDGAQNLSDVVFEAFDESGNSIGTVNAGPIGDNSFTGTTAEDRFFGVTYGDGINTGVTSFTITNIGGQGIEIDHIQFANCSVCCEIDLELSKSVDVSTGEPGDQITWTIEVTNNPAASQAATGVIIRDVLPDEFTINGASTTNGSFQPGTENSSIIWTLIDSLEPGETETLTITTTINQGAASGTMLVNTAEVIAADQSDIDSTPNNDDGDQSEDDEANAKITVVGTPLIDLELTKVVDATTVNSGDNVTWTVSVTNNEANATTAATDVTISDVLPSGLSLVSATPSGNGAFAGNTWSLIDPLAPGATATLTLVSNVNDGLAGGTMLVNTAFVAAANEQDLDSTPGDDNLAEDDADEAKVTVKELIDLELTKVLATVTNADQVQWVITLSNTSDANTDATGVVAQDTLPAGVTIIDADASGNSMYNNGQWTINEAISPGESLTLTLLGAIDPALPGGTVLTNVAEVSAADQMDIDSTPANDDGDQSEDDESSVEFVIPAAELLMLSGHSYIDTNDDGIFQANELPLLGVEIQLMGTDLSGNAVNLTTFTNLDGFYEFNDLQPGNYMVKQTQPIPFVDGKDTIGNVGGDDSVNDKFTVDLNANGEEYNFGELGLRPEYVNKRLYLTSTPYTNWQYVDVRQASIWYSFNVDHQSFLNANAVVNSGGGTIAIFDANMNLVGSEAFGVLSQSASEPILLQGGGQFFMQVTGDTVIESLSLEIVAPNVTVNGSQLIAVGTADDDNIHLQLGTANHVLNINGLIYEFDANVVTDLHIGAASGDDAVTVVGTHLNDTSSVIGTSGKLASSQYSVHTYAFDNTKFAGGGGYDYSQVYGSLGNDKLSALPNDTKLTTPDNVIQMLGFDRVDAYGRGGWDYASLYGTNSADDFVSNEHFSLLQGNGHHAFAKGFERVDAFGRGGDDTATMYDSSGNDSFVSTQNYALMSTGSRLSYTKGFAHNTAIFSNGGAGDQAVFTELKTDDHLFGEGDIAKVTTPAGRDDRALHVDHLFAYGDDFHVDVDDFDGSVDINS